MIKIKDLKKNYGTFQALKGISFEIKKGEVLGLLGPNGAGKTTTMKILTGLLSMTDGEVTIDGNNLKKETTKIQKKIGYLPENTPLYPELNVYEHLDFVAESHGITDDKKEKAIKETIEACGLTDRLYFNISELSKGYKQRVGLAQALIHNPAILILDEPTTGLDPNQIVEIRDLIKEIGKTKTIILSTHIMQEVEATCDRVIVLREGEIVAKGTPKELAKGNNKGKHITQITIKGTKKAILSALKIDGIDKVKTEESTTKGTYSFSIYSEEDMRSTITKAIVKKDLELLEISTKESSMEEVFQDLTKNKT